MPAAAGWLVIEFIQGELAAEKVRHKQLADEPAPSARDPRSGILARSQVAASLVPAGEADSTQNRRSIASTIPPSGQRPARRFCAPYDGAEKHT